MDTETMTTRAANLIYMAFIGVNMDPFYGYGLNLTPTWKSKDIHAGLKLNHVSKMSPCSMYFPHVYIKSCFYHV